MEEKYKEGSMLKNEGWRLIGRRGGRGTNNLKMYPTLIEL
jgi:hypothetical protein